MRNNNAVVDPLVVTIKITHVPNGAPTINFVAQCAVRMSGTDGVTICTADAPIAVDAELRTQTELLYSILKRRVGLTYGEG